MGLLGRIALELVADATAFSKGMEDASKSVERVAKKVKGAASEIASATTAFSAMATAAVGVAQKYDGQVHGAVERVKNSFNQLAVQVARLLLPVLSDVARFLTGLGNAFRSLSPGTKSMLAGFAEMVLVVGGVALAISKLAGVVAALGSIVGGVAAGLGGAFLPVLVGAGLAAVAIGAFYNFWTDQNSRVGQAMHQTAQFFVGVFKVATTQIRSEFELLFEGVEVLLKGLGAEMQALLSGAAKLASLTGHEDLAATLTTAGGMLNPQTIIQNLKGVAAEIPGAIADGAKAALSFSVDGYKKLLKDAAKTLGFGDLTKTAPKALTPADSVLFGKTASVDVAGDFADRQNAQIAEADAAAFNVRSMLLKLNPIQDAAVQFAKNIRRMSDVSEGFVTKVVEATDALGAKLIGRIGRAQGLAESAAQGAIVGGPAGAAVAVGVDLLTQSKQFQSIVGELDGFIQAVSDALGQLLEPLMPFLDILQPLASLLGVIVKIVSSALMPALSLLWNVALKPLAMLVLIIAKAIGDVWNGILGAVQGIFRALGSISIFGAHPFGFLNDWAESIDSAKVDTDALAGALDALGKSTYDTSVQTHKMGTAAKEAAESLSNIPSGYKIALARFNATAGATAPPGGGGPIPAPGGGGTPVPAPPPSGGPLPPPGPGSDGGGGGGGGSSGGGPGGGMGSGRHQNLVQVFLDGQEVLQRIRTADRAGAVRQTGRSSPVRSRLLGGSL